MGKIAELILKKRYLKINAVIFFILAGIVVSLWIFISSGYFNVRSNLKKRVIVAFRNDDVQGFSGSELDFDMFRLFRENNIRQTYALVPFEVDFVKNGELVKVLKRHLKSGLAEIALHGYSHENLGGYRSRTEFSGRPFHEQYEKISRGKAYLERVFNTRILTFIPPFNTYDSDTLKACKENGFRVLSSSSFFYPEDSSGIVIVNANRVLTDPLIEEIEMARKNGPALSIFVVYYHFYAGNIREKNDYYERIKKLISYIKSRDNIEVMSLGQVGLKHPDYFRQRYRLDFWSSKAGALFRFFRQYNLLKRLNSLRWCGYREKLGLFVALSMGYIYGFLFLTGFLTCSFLDFMGMNKKLLYFLSVIFLLIWITGVKIFGRDDRIGVVDVSLLVLALGFIGSNVTALLMEKAHGRSRAGA